MAEVVCPGKRLGRVSDFRSGPGTYVRGAYIFASVVGPKEEQPAAEGDGESKPFLIVSGVPFGKNGKSIIHFGPAKRTNWRGSLVSNTGMDLAL